MLFLAILGLSEDEQGARRGRPSRPRYPTSLRQAGMDDRAPQDDPYDYGSDGGSDATDGSESYSSYDSFSDGSPVSAHQPQAWMV